MPFPIPGMPIVAESECRALLESARVGRVVVSVGALPGAFPVNFVVNRGTIVFRTGPGTKMRAAEDKRVLGFEVDQFDESTCSGWSVLVVGMSEIVTDPTEIAELDQQDLCSWGSQERPRYVRIAMQWLSGRRITGGDYHPPAPGHLPEPGAGAVRPAGPWKPRPPSDG